MDLGIWDGLGWAGSVWIGLGYSAGVGGSFCLGCARVLLRGLIESCESIACCQANRTNDFAYTNKREYAYDYTERYYQNINILKIKYNQFIARVTTKKRQI